MVITFWPRQPQDSACLVTRVTRNPVTIRLTLQSEKTAKKTATEKQQSGIVLEGLHQRSSTSLKPRATPWVPINTKGRFNCVVNDIHLCENADHVNATFRTGPRATHMVIAGDLVPAGPCCLPLGSTVCTL